MTDSPSIQDRAPRRSGAGRALVAVVLLVISCARVAGAADATIAVATNFSEAGKELRRRFTAEREHELVLATGSTGQLYAQILNGAPYDALLAADSKRPRLLEQAGAAVRGSRFVYAKGRLALWSAGPGTVGEDGRQVLMQGQFERLAIANPALAPYGAASRQTLENLGLWESLQSRIVMGENIGQTHALVATGNAELGFVAMAAVMSPRFAGRGSHWEVPSQLHAPVVQEAVLLQRGAGNVATVEFLEFLKSDAARAIIRSFGYEVD